MKLATRDEGSFCALELILLEFHGASFGVYFYGAPLFTMFNSLVGNFGFGCCCASAAGDLHKQLCI
jgi:hypothetical protein